MTRAAIPVLAAIALSAIVTVAPLTAKCYDENNELIPSTQVYSNGTIEITFQVEQTGYCRMYQLPGIQWRF